MSKIALRFLAAVTLFAAALMQAKDLSKPIPQVSSTEKLAPAGAIHLEAPRGNVMIEGWDEPRVEITITKSGLLPERAQIKSERHDSEIVISTQVASGRRGELNVEYSIKAPHDSKIVIDRADGGVYVTGMTGDVEASVRRGQITFAVPEGAAYKMDAQAKLGDVYSDFEGNDKRRHLFSHDFAGGNSAGTRQLKLQVGYGDIVIMKAHTGIEGVK